MFRKTSHKTHLAPHKQNTSHHLHSNNIHHPRVASTLFIQQRSHSDERIISFLKNGPNISEEEQFSKEAIKRRELFTELATSARLKTDADNKKDQISKLLKEIRGIRSQITDKDAAIKRILDSLGENDAEVKEGVYTRPGCNR